MTQQEQHEFGESLEGAEAWMRVVQEQHEFGESLEGAEAWMRVVQERLRVSDNTQGPRSALETRLHETERIHGSEHEGRLKMDRALVAAEVLLQSGDEQTKQQTLAKLRDLKALWEETTTYIVHCHSRIEWVWLHWNEYLKAHEEFQAWLDKLQRALEAAPELQPGVREKLWQVDHAQLTLCDVQAQAPLLERLLDEAAGLHNRTEDPSVDPEKQEALQDSYSDVRDKAEERLLLLQKIAEDHQQHQDCVNKFQTWLLSKEEEIRRFSQQADSTENKLQLLQELETSIADEERTLRHIESLAEPVKASTSPAGAEEVARETAGLRAAWERLRMGLQEARGGLQDSLDSRGQYEARCGQLRTGIGELRSLVQRLARELEGSDGDRERERSEEQLVTQWRRCTGVRNTLIDEEPRAELLKDRLKELIHFSQDCKPLSDELLLAVKEYQSLKGRAFRLSSESETGLRQVLQDPLHGFSQWSQMVSQVLEASAEVSEFSHIALLVQNIEKLLKQSLQLQERLSLLQVKRDLLGCVFGPEAAEGLLSELSANVRRRELLHSQLLQRKSRLQGLISRTKDFGDAYGSIRKKLAFINELCLASHTLQPDILAKKSQCDQLRVLKRDLEDCEAHITALETLVSSSPTNRAKFECLFADWNIVYKTVRVRVNECEHQISEHEVFHESLLSVEKWLMIMRQKLESFRSSGGEWSVENRQHEAERALGEFPEKEQQLRQTEHQGQNVLAKTSEEGKVHIIRDLKRLRESWKTLQSLSFHLHRLLNGQGSQVKGQTAGETAGGVRGQGSGGQAGAKGTAENPRGPRRRLWEHEGSADAHGDGLEMDEELAALSGLAALDTAVSAQSGGGAGQPNLLPSNGRGQTVVSGGQSVEEVDSDRSGGELGASAGRTAQRGGLSVCGDAGASRRTGQWVEEHAAASGGEGGALEDGEGYSPGLSLRARRRSGEQSGLDGSRVRGARRDASGRDSGTTPTPTKGGRGPADSGERHRHFDIWLQRETDKLSGILSSHRAISAKELKIRENTLKALRSRVPWGQGQFQQLLDSRVAGSVAGAGPEVEDVELEDLRYRWMLHKSKLKDVGELRDRLRVAESCCGFLSRVCRVALPLQLLLLALLLLAFLLPMMDEGTSCSLSNNFARSFNIMLRYDGPPPT
ncbi:nesprin-3 isoform X2 [Alosa pseudoharengus]|uniref:nesprin-3 isoform X2 n=1 Tax=Alosa pseudoharengus TaxID=34774 RepID=UPI003F8BC869